MADAAWSVLAALDWTREFLARKGDEHPRLSAEWLLSAATGLSRVELYANHDRPLSPEEREALRESVRRRGEGEPLQYVTGEVAFRHLVLKVRPGVLIPRPETEVLVDEALKVARVRESPLVVDVCTGSGCVALAVAQEHPGATVLATDISPAAVLLARENAGRLGLDQRVEVLECDLLGGLDDRYRGSVDIVVSNPPYVPSGQVHSLPAEVAGFEPHLALDGGVDGLDVFRRLLRESREWLRPGGTLAVELDENRVRTASQEALEWYEEVRVVQDLAGRDRVLTAKLPRTP